MVLGGVVIETGGEVRQVAAREVQLQVVAGAGAPGGAVLDDLATRPVGTALEDAVGEQADAGERREIGHALPGRLVAAPGDGVQRRHGGRREIPRQRHRIERLVDLEGERLDGPVFFPDRVLDVRR